MYQQVVKDYVRILGSKVFFLFYLILIFYLLYKFQTPGETQFATGELKLRTKIIMQYLSLIIFSLYVLGEDDIHREWSITTFYLVFLLFGFCAVVGVKNYH